MDCVSQKGRVNQGGRETKKERDRQTDRHGKREGERERERERDGQPRLGGPGERAWPAGGTEVKVKSCPGQVRGGHRRLQLPPPPPQGTRLGPSPRGSELGVGGSGFIFEASDARPVTQATTHDHSWSCVHVTGSVTAKLQKCLACHQMPPQRSWL
jgi:hypothetical protein